MLILLLPGCRHTPPTPPWMSSNHNGASDTITMPATNSDAEHEAALSLISMSKQQSTETLPCLSFLQSCTACKSDDTDELFSEIFCMMKTYARESRSRKSKGIGKDDAKPRPMVNVPELFFVFYVYCKEKMAFQAPSWKNRHRRKFNASACLQVKQKSKRGSDIDLNQMRAIIDEYGPELSSRDRELSSSASPALIRRRFHKWNPSFKFSFFYCPYRARWLPYLGVMGEKTETVEDAEMVESGAPRFPGTATARHRQH
jgi:hypothetical protein